MKKSGWILFISICAGVIVLAVSLAFFWLLPQKHYTQAERFRADGYYLDAIDEYLQAGSYLDAAEKAESLKRLVHYENGKNAYLAGDFTDAIVELRYVSDYLDAAELIAEAEKALQYVEGEEAYESGDYKAAEQAFRRASDYRDAPTMVVYSRVRNVLSQGDALLENKDFEGAIEQYRAAEAESAFDNHLKEEIREKIEDAQYLAGERDEEEGAYQPAAEWFLAAGSYKDAKNRAIVCAKKLLDEGKTDEARAIFEQTSAGKRYLLYLSAMDAVENEEYEKAIGILREIGIFEDAEDRMKETCYLYGQQLFAKEDYKGAREAFLLAGDYEGASEALLQCDFADAEEQFFAGHLNTALEMYKALPESLELDGVSVAGRIFRIQSHKDLLLLTGKYTCTKAWPYEVRATKKSDKSFNFWHNTDGKAELVILITLNDDDTITVFGKVEFCAYTNYSEEASKLNAEYLTVEFEQTSSSFPETITAENIEIKPEDGSFYLTYQKTDDQTSTTYTYLFTSEAVFDERTEEY